MTEVDLSYAVKLPPELAMEYFRGKGYQITFDWHEMLAEAHDVAFTVAKAMETDLLEDIRAAVAAALAEGQTLEEFRAGLTPLLKKKGWWGKREILDERTGEIREAQLGSPWRLRTIYQTNLQTAYMAGRQRAMEENTADRPWWLYVAVLDSRTRPAHRALNGSAFSHDDPFWKSHYPPNGWGCRCRVRALDADELAERVRDGRAKVQSTTGENPTGIMGEVERPLTRHQSTMVKSFSGTGLDGRPVALTPDAGWDYAPGDRRRALADLLRRKETEQ